MGRVEYREAFVDNLRVLNEADKRRVIGFMREVVANPRGPATNIRELPPMHKPGTMQASFAEWLIRYVVTYDDNSTNPGGGSNGSEVVVFLRLLRRPMH
jgi:hypothetical protein